jgi:hypothetical protein
MPSAGFEPTISAGERPQTYTLDRAATRNKFNVLETKYGEADRRKKTISATVHDFVCVKKTRHRAGI